MFHEFVPIIRQEKLYSEQDFILMHFYKELKSSDGVQHTARQELMALK